MTLVMKQAKRNLHPGPLAVRFLFLAAFFPLVLVAAPLPSAAGEPAGLETPTAAPGSVEAGGKAEGTPAKAVYYARRYQGRRTSSGASYDARQFTAAHPTLPLGTRLQVQNLANHRSVVVTVNDRCAKRPYEIIDLSLAAARTLGFVRQGKAEVRLIPVEP